MITNQCMPIQIFSATRTLSFTFSGVREGKQGKEAMVDKMWLVPYNDHYGPIDLLYPHYQLSLEMVTMALLIRFNTKMARFSKCRFHHIRLSIPKWYQLYR